MTMRAVAIDEGHAVQIGRDSSRGGERAFRPDIAGLRAIAVLLVLIGHSGVGLVSGGYVGVDVFFVISGFLITSNLTGELATTGRIRFGRFYARRMLRLLPASILVVLVTLVATWHWASPMFANAASADALAAVAYVINMRLAFQGTNYFSASDPPSPLQHYWSLGVEEQFYLLWPMILAAGSLIWFRRARPSLKSARIVLAVLGVGSLAVCVWLTDSSQPWAYFSLPARAWELAAGGLIAMSVQRLAKVPCRLAAVATWLGLGAIVASAVLYTEATAFPGIAAVLPVGGAALLIAAGCAAPRGGAVAVLGLRPMQLIGKVSYSWYLWHWPALILAPYVLGHQPDTLTKLGLVTAALVPAALSLILVEDHIRFHPALRRSPRAGLVFGLSLSLLAAGVAVVAVQLPTAVRGHGTAARTADVLASPTSFEPFATLILASADASALPANLVPAIHRAKLDRPDDRGCILDFADVSLRPGCERFGVPDSPHTVVLLGDSHARQWFGALDAIARERGWRLVSMVKGGCTASSALTFKARAEPFTECTEWREKAIERINSLKPRLVVMAEREVGLPPLNYSGTPAEAWGQAWSTTVRSLQPSGARLAVLGDTPYLQGVMIPDCLAQNREDIRKCNVPEAGAFDIERRTGMIKALRVARVEFIDTTRWFCVEGVCPAIIGNVLVYRDNSHVTATYVRLLTPELGRLLPG